jgi:hypothetical protein
MAITYRLALATALPAAEVALALPAGALTGTTTAAGVWLRVAAVDTPPWHAVVTDLGLSPTVSAVFERDKTGDPARQVDEVVRMAADLLAAVPGDAVLHQDVETIWLLRRGAELTVSDRDDLWSPARLAALTQPYRRGALAFAA